VLTPLLRHFCCAPVFSRQPSYNADAISSRDLSFMSVFARICFLFLALGSSLVAYSAIDIYEFETESQRHRYHVLVDELRCPKCQNQNLAGSNSEIATDLRRELHRLLVEGKTDREIKDFMVARYGDFVLYRPPLQTSTLMLWSLPLLLLLIGALTAIMIVRQRRRVSTTAECDLSATDRSALARILNENDSSETSFR
jgi:cytochrome c-type biogenesis protein CcmH